MSNAAHYFALARKEEVSENEYSALLLYLSSFCDSFNSGTGDFPYGTVAKIQKLQNRLFISELQLLELVHSYGPLSDDECQELLTYSIYGSIAGIKSTLSGCSHGY